jgi:endo-1,4-beta-xylanase
MLGCKSLAHIALAGAIVLSGMGFGQSLRDEAERHGLLVGTAARAYLLSEQQYTATLSREYNLLEPENDLKWQTIHPALDTFNFLPGDQLVEFARLHGMKVRGHCLVWGHYLPQWLAEGHFTPARLRALLQEHVTKVVGHYKGKIYAWDVVNEAFDEKGLLRSSIWYDEPGIGEAGHGTAYIEDAFRWAHEADPNALLFYNDAEAEGMNVKSDAIYAAVRDMKRRGVPIHGVGLEMHILRLNADFDGIAANIRRLTRLGLQVHITELDVALPVDANGRPRDPADLQRQAEIYRGIARACFSTPGCSAVQTWGFTDKYSWIRSWTKGNKGNATLFDLEYAPKPAYQAVRGVLRQLPQKSPAPTQ